MHRYYSWTDVTASADMMGPNGQVIPNVLVRDVSLLKHLIRSKGYTGEFRELPLKKGDTGGRIRIKVEGSVRGSFPLPFVQFNEGESTHVPLFEEEYKCNNGEIGNIN
jgi:hypothetical protein